MKKPHLHQIVESYHPVAPPALIYVEASDSGYGRPKVPHRICTSQNGDGRSFPLTYSRADVNV